MGIIVGMNNRIGGGGGDTPDIFFSGTTADVKALRSQGKLVPGASYRITDYVATTTQEGTQSANHPFDIIVKAIAPDTLSEEALAAPHAGDTYFTGLGAKLEAWRLMYCIDNDADRFVWADTENGKGVVYRMIDEWGNDAPYDFKGILILRDAAFWSGNDAATALAENTFGTQTPGDKYLYLFSAVDGEGNILDASSTRISAVIEDEPAGLIICMENVFAGYNGSYRDDGECIYAIANNVFLAKISDEDWEHLFSVSYNTFGGYVTDNTFVGNVYFNTFIGSMYDNTFIDDVANNVFSGNLSENIFSAPVDGNVFSGNMQSSTFYEYVDNNAFNGSVFHCTFSGPVTLNAFTGGVSFTHFPGEMRHCTFSGSVSQVTFQAVHNGGFSCCSFEGDFNGVTIAATGPVPEYASASEFSQLRFVGITQPNAAQSISVQKRSMTEQVIAADADGILHVFTPWITP